MIQALRFRKSCARLLLFLLSGLALFTLFPERASAIPAWARRYGVPCSTCHYPAPPRLNAYGHRFRRAQYRLPEEFNQEPEWSKVQNYVAVRAVGGYTYSSADQPGSDVHDVTSTFTLDEINLFYAGPVTKHFSGFIELARPGDDTGIEALASVGGVFGKPDSFTTFRFGQFHTLVEAGWGGLDRSTGISSPDALSTPLTTATGFTLDQDQVGVEGTYVRKNWRIIGQVLNGANAVTTDGVLNPDLAFSTTDHADQNKNKDYVLAYELMWGDTASGLTAFGYKGVVEDPIQGPDNPDPALSRIDMTRLGLTAAQVWESGWEIQGGYVSAKDNFQNPALADIKGQGWWIELEKYYKKLKDMTLLLRYDLTDPDTDVAKNSRTGWVLGAVWPVGEWHTKLAVEIRDVTQENGAGNPDLKTKEGAFELQLSF